MRFKHLHFYIHVMFSLPTDRSSPVLAAFLFISLPTDRSSPVLAAFLFICVFACFLVVKEQDYRVQCLYIIIASQSMGGGGGG